MIEPTWRFYVISMSESKEKSFLENKMSRYARHDKKIRTGLPGHPGMRRATMPGNDKYNIRTYVRRI